MKTFKFNIPSTADIAVGDVIEIDQDGTVTKHELKDNGNLRITCEVCSLKSFCDERNESPCIMKNNTYFKKLES